MVDAYPQVLTENWPDAVALARARVVGVAAAVRELRRRRAERARGVAAEHHAGLVTGTFAEKHQIPSIFRISRLSNILVYFKIAFNFKHFFGRGII